MNVELLIKKGAAALSQGKPERALQCFSRVEAALPGNPSALSYRGIALSALGRHQDALECFRKAAAAAPDSAEVRGNLGFLLNILHRHEEALVQLDRGLALTPGDANLLNNRGLALHQLRRNAEALICFEQAVTADPNHADAWANRATVLNAMGRHDEELAGLDRTLAINPAHALAQHNRGMALLKLGRPEEALVDLERACALGPQAPHLRLSLSAVRLLLGDFAGGFRDFESRWDTAPLNLMKPPTNRKLWLGKTPLEGKTILLHCEQGFGDALQFVRYAPLVAARGARVILRLPSPLMELMGRMQGIAQLVAEGEPLPAHDLHCPLMSLPLAFGTTLETIPADIPYLHADPSRVAEWKARLGPASRPRIGLVWTGRQQPPINYVRDMALQHVLPLFEVEADFISLQKDIPEADRPRYDQLQNLSRHGESLKDFADTAALMENLDLLITVDTSVAHLAGALGKPVWVMNRFDTCWRWLRHRSDSPWYPSLRLFRQPTLGDWNGVVRDVRQALLQRSERASATSESTVLS
jgi:tetratricopeptide (TPR) repeat protein